MPFVSFLTDLLSSLVHKRDSGTLSRRRLTGLPSSSLTVQPPWSRTCGIRTCDRRPLSVQVDWNHFNPGPGSGGEDQVGDDRRVEETESLWVLRSVQTETGRFLWVRWVVEGLQTRDSDTKGTAITLSGPHPSAPTELVEFGEGDGG